MENVNIVSIIISYLIPAILGGIIGFFSTKLRNLSKKAKEKEEENQRKDKAIEEGVQALLRNELVRRYREYETKGELSILDKENIEDMFIQYQKLGGNGTVKQLMNELLKLPTKVINN